MKAEHKKENPPFKITVTEYEHVNYPRTFAMNHQQQTKLYELMNYWQLNHSKAVNKCIDYLHSIIIRDSK